MLKYLRSKRTASLYEDAQQFKEKELSQNNSPDASLSCNHVKEDIAVECLIKMKASNLPKPITKSIAGIYLPASLSYIHKPIKEDYFQLVQKTHYCLDGASGIDEIARRGFDKNDLVPDKSVIFTHIDVQEKIRDTEWLGFLEKNPKWQKKLLSYRKQKALYRWKEFIGAGFSAKNIDKSMKLDQPKTTKIIKDIIDAHAATPAELDLLSTYLR